MKGSEYKWLMKRPILDQSLPVSLRVTSFQTVLTLHATLMSNFLYALIVEQ